MPAIAASFEGRKARRNQSAGWEKTRGASARGTSVTGFGCGEFEGDENESSDAAGVAQRQLHGRRRPRREGEHGRLVDPKGVEETDERVCLRRG